MPFPDLPVDIARYIFELAASLDRRTILSLVLVSHAVRAWIEPSLYSQVSLSTSSAARAFAASTKLRSRSDFLRRHVKAISFGDITTGGIRYGRWRNEPAEAILATCSSAARVALWIDRAAADNAVRIITKLATGTDDDSEIPTTFTPTSPPRQALTVTHISLLDLIPHDFDDPSVSPTQVAGPALPTVTHVHLDECENVRKEEYIMWAAAIHARFPALTHLHLSGRGIDALYNNLELDAFVARLLLGLPANFKLCMISVVPLYPITSTSAGATTATPTGITSGGASSGHVAMVKKITDPRVIMTVPFGSLPARIEGAYCFERAYAAEKYDWAHDDSWEWAEKYVAARDSRVLNAQELGDPRTS